MIYAQIFPFIDGFSKTMKFIWLHFETRNFDYAAARGVLVCLHFIGGIIFFPMADDQTFSVFVWKMQNKQGNLLLSWESWFLCTRSGFLFQILVAHK